MDSGKPITISATMMRHALSGVISSNFDLSRLLKKCQVDQSVFFSTTGRLPLEKVVMLLRHCNGVMQDEANGLLQEPIRIGWFRAMALSVVHCRTLGQAIERILEFANLFENSFIYTKKADKKQVKIILQRIPEHQVTDNYAINSMFTVLHRFCGWLCNDRILLNQITLDFPSPDYRHEFKYMFYGAPVLFNQELNAISFDRQYLDHPIIQTEASVENYVRRAPMDIFLPLDAGGPWTKEVRNRLKEVFSVQKQLPQLEFVADELSLTTQTLRRRLKSEGSSFESIKAQLRRDIAINHLGNNQFSIEAVAEACGYTEPSSFIRAFRNWTGFTPLQFRKGLNI